MALQGSKSTRLPERNVLETLTRRISGHDMSARLCEKRRAMAFLGSSCGPSSLTWPSCGPLLVGAWGASYGQHLATCDCHRLTSPAQWPSTPRWHLGRSPTYPNDPKVSPFKDATPIPSTHLRSKAQHSCHRTCAIVT